MKEYVSVGKNVDIAIEDGLRHLGLSREEVDIKILETGGLFKKAKVCLMYEDKVEIEPVIMPEIVAKPVVENLVEDDNAEEVMLTEPEKEEIVEEKPIEQDVKVEQVEIIEPEKAVNPKVSADELIARVKEFIVNLAKNMKLEVSVDCEINDNDLNFNVTGQNVGKLIGYRGETLSAIQTLLNGLKQAGEGKFRLYLDIENYKKAREQTLVDLANKMADKAEEIERNVHLDAMSAYERRIIHSALQGRELVETESMGEGEKRHVVIKFKR